ASGNASWAWLFWARSRCTSGAPAGGSGPLDLVIGDSLSLVGTLKTAVNPAGDSGDTNLPPFKGEGVPGQLSPVPGVLVCSGGPPAAGVRFWPTSPRGARARSATTSTARSRYPTILMYHPLPPPPQTPDLAPRPASRSTWTA